MINKIQTKIGIDENISELTLVRVGSHFKLFE